MCNNDAPLELKISLMLLKVYSNLELLVWLNHQLCITIHVCFVKLRDRRHVHQMWHASN